MPTCTFCKKNFKEPRGLTIYSFDGKPTFFCSSKCRKNTALKRDPKKTDWVKRRKAKTREEEKREKLEQIKEETGGNIEKSEKK